MDGPRHSTTRALIFVWVLAIHAALLAWLIQTRNARIATPADPLVELLFIPPTQIPRIRMGTSTPRRLRTDIATVLEPPRFGSTAPTGARSASDDHDSGVNWAAEAHRAVRAFEIRRDAVPSSALSVSSSPEDSWLQREHHAGDRYKTDSGDWIVWIDADCYRVAGWPQGGAASDAAPPATVCKPKPPQPQHTAN
jgi:hypothetical protein